MEEPSTTEPALPPEPELVESRARALTPEEQEAGVDDAHSLAESVLGESEARTADRSATAKEHRRSEETIEPAETGPAPEEPE